MKRKQVILEVRTPNNVSVKVKRERITKASKKKRAMKSKKRKKRRG